MFRGVYYGKAFASAGKGFGAECLSGGLPFSMWFECGRAVNHQRRAVVQLLEREGGCYRVVSYIYGDGHMGYL